MPPNKPTKEHFPSLPHDVFTLIWDALSAGDEPDSVSSLSSCSLVCQAWRDPCQRRLFSCTQVNITPWNSASKGNLLSSSSHLQMLAVNIKIIITNLKPHHMKRVSSILQELPYIHTLEIWGEYPGAVWGCGLQDHFLTSLCHAVSRPSLTNLIFSSLNCDGDPGCSQLYRVLNHATHLQILHLISVTLQNNDNRYTHDFTPAINQIGLKKLTLLARSGLAGFLRPFDFSALKELCISQREEGLCNLPGIIPSLEKLTMVAEMLDHFACQNVVDLSRASSDLKILAFKVHTKGRPKWLLQWVIDTLQTLPPTNKVVHLEFTMFAIDVKSVNNKKFSFPAMFFNRWKSQGGGRDTFLSEWEKVGQAIASSRYPHLTTVCVSTFGSPKRSIRMSWLDFSNLAVTGLRNAFQKSHRIPCPVQIKAFAKEFENTNVWNNYSYSRLLYQ